MSGTPFDIPVVDFHIPADWIGTRVTVYEALPTQVQQSSALAGGKAQAGIGFPNSSGTLVADLPGTVVIEDGISGNTNVVQLLIPKQRIWKIERSRPDLKKSGLVSA